VPAAGTQAGAGLILISADLIDELSDLATDLAVLLDSSQQPWAAAHFLIAGRVEGHHASGAGMVGATQPPLTPRRIAPAVFVPEVRVPRAFTVGRYVQSP
jgi:hypothetical protein